MNQSQYEEMRDNLNKYSRDGALSKGSIFVFGHCEASLTVIDELLSAGYEVTGILDNSKEKQGINYKGIPVVFPDITVTPENNTDSAVVFLATRFYEQMNRQLRELGFKGKVVKLVDYNTYAEYSLSEDTLDRKFERVQRGQQILEGIKKKYDGAFIVFCPFNALGDVYLCMSYLPYFLKRKGIERFVLCVPSRGCYEVAKLFTTSNHQEFKNEGNIEALPQSDLDAAVQAALFTHDGNTFIAHQDRPYIINLHKVLHVKKIPLEDIYKIGIFDLDPETEPIEPANWSDYDRLDDIDGGKAAILSPYAKSVTALPEQVWSDIVCDLKDKGYQVFTNVFGDEKPIPGTEPISPAINEMKSVVERSGLFIGIRSGLCDILRTAGCRKIALFPDYYYGDTKWKAIDMYELPGFENIVVGGDFKWQMN